MDLARLRNIGVAAHIDAGKTTVTERILHLCGREHRVGRVDEGTATMDWMEEERERGITITAAATRVRWQDYEINLIDTPGHVDFTVEVERCMRVLDGAVLVVDAVAGVQAQTETVWRQVRRREVPCIGFVNKCDKVGSDVLGAIQSIRDRLDAPAVPLAYPFSDEEGKVRGIVELLERRAFTFDEDGRAEATELPPEVADEVGVLRAELVDALADGDEAILEAVLDDHEPPVDALRAALRRRTIAGELVPVLCGAALRGIGVQPLLDAIVAYLPCPTDVPPPRAFDRDGATMEAPPADPDAPLAALAFKVHSTAHADLTFVRVYSGRLRTGVKLWNPRVRRMERAAQILRMHALTSEALQAAEAGDIVAVTGLKETGTGDTLCDRAHELSLEPAVFPEPVIGLVVEPNSAGDRDKLRQALLRLEREDPSFHVREDEAAGQWTIEGMGELHLEVVIHRLEREFHVAPRVGQPQVSYREAVGGTGRGTARVERTIGGKDAFAVLELEVAPSKDGAEGLAVTWAPDAPVREAFRPAVEEALVAESTSGPLLGYPLVGAAVRVVGGDRRDDRDLEAGWAVAAVEAMRGALGDAGSHLLEPRMTVVVETPEEFASGVIADLNSRHAEVEDVRSEAGVRRIRGLAPLARMFGYSTALRSLTQGRAAFTLEPAGFVRVPEAELAERGLVLD